MKKSVLSLFDFTGVAVRPWAEAGHTCYCFDIQHDWGKTRTERVGNGSIIYVHWDALARGAVAAVCAYAAQGAAMVLGFGPCDDLANSGTRHWAAKRLKLGADFQVRAAKLPKMAETVGNRLKAPYLSENPAGALPRFWRKWNYTFHPHQYGGYIPRGQWKHPRWPEFIAPRDAYKKLTCLWTGNGFVMPPPRPVAPEVLDNGRGREGTGDRITGSRQFKKLGGKSLKTKNIRSASPRGFFIAVYQANGGVTMR